MAEGALAEVAEGLELRLGVIHAADEGVLVGRPATRLGDILTHDVVEVQEGVLTDARHELVPGLLDRGVE